jgi:glutathione S-transferase
MYKTIRQDTTMKLYFSPMACSLATRIAIYEANLEAQFIQVELRNKQLTDGASFLTITAMGQVPALETEEGFVLTENTAVLQYIAERAPQAKLSAASGPERARLQQWLGFIGTELHKAVFVPLLDPNASDTVRDYARDKAPTRLSVVDSHLNGREFLLNSFTVADAYLTTVLNWAQVTAIDLAQWPAVNAYYARMSQRPSISRAVKEEWGLYAAEQAKPKNNAAD